MANIEYQYPTKSLKYLSRWLLSPDHGVNLGSLNVKLSNLKTYLEGCLACRDEGLLCCSGRMRYLGSGNSSRFKRHQHWWNLKGIVSRDVWLQVFFTSISFPPDNAIFFKFAQIFLTQGWPSVLPAPLKSLLSVLSTYWRSTLQGDFASKNKIEMVPTGINRGPGEPNPWRNPEVKISWHCLFQQIYCILCGFMDICRDISH